MSDRIVLDTQDTKMMHGFQKEIFTGESVYANYFAKKHFLAFRGSCCKYIAT